MRTFTGKVALVTGASSAIGAATEKKPAEAGVKVGIVARVWIARNLTAEIERHGGQALVLEMDVADKASVEAGVKKLLDTYSKVDTPWRCSSGILDVGFGLWATVTIFRRGLSWQSDRGEI